MTFLKLATALFALAPSGSHHCTLETRRFSTAAPSTDIPQKYQDLLSWIESQGAEINNKVVIQVSSRGGGYGAAVSENVQEDELLFTIPRKACVTLQNVREDVKCGDAFKELMKKAGPGGNTVCMAGFLAKEYLIMQQDLQNENEDSTIFGPYLATLPWERGVNNQEHTLYWSDEDIEALLKGSLSYQEAKELRDEVDLATRVLGGIIGPSIRDYRGESVESSADFSWPWEAKPQQPTGPVEGLSQAVMGAFVSMLTRSFQDGETGDEEKLVPLLDMLQHSEEPNIRHGMRKADGTVEVRARCYIPAGEELLNQYRSEEEESMPYHRFFTRYGFVPGIMEPIPNLLKDRSPIFYSQKAEV